ncbi:DUF4232 domain-containing protein [Streptomyces physcomitrii]|uniref:DUF4232 domain-containing protein n=1 Tax=Streptomyces physcomitrii TaxID=2724184 RepID=A0ABX1H0W9_9ACTN|nr:DUF4232 domain-containing protein [Streptomyces physcomitrii]NKI42017.1 DUF4232 domain-containing protein [Streptomyces physcomitrii]
MTSPEDPRDLPGPDRSPLGPGAEQEESAGIRAAFARPSTPLPPPPGAFARIRRRAAARRRRRVLTVAVVACGAALATVTVPAGFLTDRLGTLSDHLGSGGDGTGPPAEHVVPASDAPATGRSPQSPRESSAGPTRTPAPRPSDISGPPEAEATETAAPKTPQCSGALLTLSRQRSEQAAGSRYLTLRLVNTDGPACTTRGFPGVSLAKGPDGARVGSPAERSGGPGGRITLARGEAASFVVQLADTGNYEKERCRPGGAESLRVYLPGRRESVLLDVDGLRTCTAKGYRTLHVTALTRS